MERQYDAILQIRGAAINPRLIFTLFATNFDELGLCG